MAFPDLKTVNWQLVALNFFVFLKQAYELTLSGGKKVVGGMIEYSRPNEWLFFEGCTMPLPAWKFHEGKAGSAEVVWRFSPETMSFYGQSGEVADKKLSWLSAEIKYNEISLYSLDDFIENISYFGHVSPSPAVLVAAWSIGSGIVLSQTLGLTLSVIDENGRDLVLPINSQNPATHAVAPAITNINAQNYRYIIQNPEDIPNIVDNMWVNSVEPVLNVIPDTLDMSKVD